MPDPTPRRAPAAADWAAYWQELHDLIDDPANGLLLDAELDYDAEGGEVRTEGVLFKLASGQFRRNFVSLWELYDHREEFARCMEALADKAIAFGREAHFDTIVTCTQTSREFVHPIRAKVEKELGHPVRVIVFGHYPWASVAEQDASDFDARKVLILTDAGSEGPQGALTPFRSVGPQPRDNAFSGSRLRQEGRADPV